MISVLAAWSSRSSSTFFCSCEASTSKLAPSKGSAGGAAALDAIVGYNDTVRLESQILKQGTKSVKGWREARRMPRRLLHEFHYVEISYTRTQERSSSRDAENNVILLMAGQRWLWSAAAFASSWGTRNTRQRHTRCTIAHLTATTVPQVLEQLQADFEAAGTPEPEASSVHLLAHVLDLPWDTGFRDVRFLQRNISKQEQEELKQLVARRKKHEPLQYILGQWDFHQYTIQIRPPLLCPRPETEELVDLVVNDIPNDQSAYSVLDIGCGTGCIGIAVADLRPHARVSAIDIDPIAIQVSRDNSRTILRSPSQYEVFQTDIRDFNTHHPFDVIVSNPPYIPAATPLDRTVREFESHQALFAGPDGLDVIRVILDRLPVLLVDGGICWMEVDTSHPEILSDLLHDTILLEERREDLFGNPRFVKLRKKSNR